MKILLRPLLSLFLAIGFLPSFCQVIDAKICDSTTRFPITQYASFLRTTETITIDSVIKSQSYFIKANNEPVLVFNYDPYYYWFRIVIKNTQDKSRNLMLLMAPVGMYEGRLFQKINGEWGQVAQTGLKYKFRDRSYQFTHHVFPFTLTQKSIDTLYLSIDASNVYKSFGFALLQPKELKIFENKIYFVFGIIVGLLILFFVLNVSLFFALNEKLHLWYALYIALLFLVVMKNDHLDQQFLGLDSEMAFRLTPYLAIGALAITVLMHVVQNFLKVTLIHHKLLYRASLILKINVLCSAIIHSFVFLMVHDYHIQSIVFNWTKTSILLGVCIIIVNCLYCVVKGFKSALFIFSGSLVFMIGAVQRLFYPSTLSFLFPPTTFHIGIILETFVISLGLIYRYWSEKELQRKREEQIQIQFSQTLLQSQIEIQEHTLRHISRELHDNLGQVASLIKINLNTLQISDPAKATEKIQNTLELTRQLVTDIKSLSVSLGSDRLSQTGLSKAIETEVERLNKTEQFTASYELTGTMPEIDNDKMLILYRMAQEVLHNIVKHSRAKQINISLNASENFFKLTFNDDGVGFNVEEKTDSPGAGLRNLKIRALLINARLHIQSDPGNGTLITIELPL